jgi:hypothetical protein
MREKKIAKRKLEIPPHLNAFREIPKDPKFCSEVQEKILRFER